MQKWVEADFKSVCSGLTLKCSKKKFGREFQIDPFSDWELLRASVMNKY